ncbi:uncharacterized protein LOC134822431 [Bolinopsis microptera]|uniref:uncharacterized protein LOC134822431 n=1 Tax=Bolinopsis microptera TaxID=2820187 RepID=UPI00307A723A
MGWFQRHYNWWILISVCLGSTGMGLPFFSYGALLPYLSSLFYHNTGEITSQAAMSLQPVILLMGIALTGFISGILEKYMNVRLLLFILTTLYVAVVAVSYYIETYYFLTISVIFIGTLAGQINICNVSRLSEWNPRKAGTANGIMGFFMGISGFIGSFLCTVVINPYNKQPVEVSCGNETAMLFVDSSVIDHTQYIWLAWAFVLALLFLPGLFILRPPLPEEERKLFDSMIESYEAGEERSPLIQNKNSDYGERDTDPDNIPYEIYAADEFAESAKSAESAEPDPDYSIKETLKQPRFYVLYLVVSTLSLTLLTSSELYKVIAIEAINDDRFLNMVGALASVMNAFGRLTWGMILDQIGMRYTFTLSFLVMGPLTISLHYTKWSRYGYLVNLCIVTFCTGIFTCIAPACQELFGRKDISMKYAAILSAEGVGCVLFFVMQLGKDFLYGELAFLIMMGIPAIVASLLAYVTFSRCVCLNCLEWMYEKYKNNDQ